MKIIGSYITYETLTSHWNVNALTLLSEAESTRLYLRLCLLKVL